MRCDRRALHPTRSHQCASSHRKQEGTGISEIPTELFRLLVRYGREERGVGILWVLEQCLWNMIHHRSGSFADSFLIVFSVLCNAPSSQLIILDFGRLLTLLCALILCSATVWAKASSSLECGLSTYGSIRAQLLCFDGRETDSDNETFEFLAPYYLNVPDQL